jgi:hypothetical protein
VKPPPTAEEARVRVGTALAVIELAAQVLDELPLPEVAFRLDDRELYRYLQAAETARGWLVGHGAGESVDHPGASSALGDGERIYAWSEEETERHFQSALEDWSER